MEVILGRFTIDQRFLDILLEGRIKKHPQCFLQVAPLGLNLLSHIIFYKLVAPPELVLTMEAELLKPRRGDLFVEIYNKIII